MSVRPPGLPRRLRSRTPRSRTPYTRLDAPAVDCKHGAREADIHRELLFTAMRVNRYSVPTARVPRDGAGSSQRRFSPMPRLKPPPPHLPFTTRHPVLNSDSSDAQKEAVATWRGGGRWRRVSGSARPAVDTCELAALRFLPPTSATMWTSVMNEPSTSK